MLLLSLPQTMPELVAVPGYTQRLTKQCAMQLGGSMKPSRIRVLDLPFTAVEWVLPEDMTPAQYLGKDKWMVWERSPLAKERSLFGYWDDADEGQLALAATGSTEHERSDAQHSGSGQQPPFTSSESAAMQRAILAVMLPPVRHS